MRVPRLPSIRWLRPTSRYVGAPCATCRRRQDPVPAPHIRGARAPRWLPARDPCYLLSPNEKGWVPEPTRSTSVGTTTAHNSSAFMGSFASLAATRLRVGAGFAERYHLQVCARTYRRRWRLTVDVDDRTLGEGEFGEALRASPPFMDVAIPLLLTLFPGRQVLRGSAGRLAALHVGPPLEKHEARRLLGFLYELVGRPEWRDRCAVAREVTDVTGTRTELILPLAPHEYDGGEALVGPFGT